LIVGALAVTSCPDDDKRSEVTRRLRVALRGYINYSWYLSEIGNQKKNQFKSIVSEFVLSLQRI